MPFDRPAAGRKKVCAAADGGRISSDGGVLLLAQAARRLGIADKLAAAIDDPRDPVRVRHLLPDILLSRILAVAAGYEDASDRDRLRHGPAFKMAAGRLPEAAVGLCSQPAIARSSAAIRQRSGSEAAAFRRKPRVTLGERAAFARGHPADGHHGRSFTAPVMPSHPRR